MVHYKFYEKPPLVPVIARPTNLFQVRSYISLPSRPRFCKWSLSLRFLRPNPICTSSLHHTCHISVSLFFISFHRIFGEGTWRHLVAKVGTSKRGGKQWQTTPKNLPRMQRTRAIPVARLSSGLCPNRPKG